MRIGGEQPFLVCHVTDEYHWYFLILVCGFTELLFSNLRVMPSFFQGTRLFSSFEVKPPFLAHFHGLASSQMFLLHVLGRSPIPLQSPGSPADFILCQQPHPKCGLKLGLPISASSLDGWVLKTDGVFLLLSPPGSTPLLTRIMSWMHCCWDLNLCSLEWNSHFQARGWPEGQAVQLPAVRLR